MKLQSFSLLDKVLERGVISIHKDECLELPKEIYTGQIVIRYQDQELCQLFSNVILEQEIKRVVESNLTNKMRRIYQMLGTREPYVVEQMIERIKRTEYYPHVDNSKAWNILLEKGKYMETAAEISPSLDLMIYNQILEYECEGYYSPHSEWVRKIKNNKILSFDKGRELIRCQNDVIVSKWLSSFGYEINGNRYILAESERSKSGIFSAQ